MKYNWQQKDWPEFHYDLSNIEEDVAKFQQQTDRTGKALHYQKRYYRKDLAVPFYSPYQKP